MNPLNESLDILKKRKKLGYIIIALIFLILFSQSFFAGQYLYKTDKEKAESFIEMVSNTARIQVIANAFKEGNYFFAGALIFSNNLLINAFSMYLGVIFLVPVFILVSNAVAIGMIFGIESLMPPQTTINHLILTAIVGTFEIISLVLVTYEGLRIGFSWINPEISNKKNRKDALKQAIKEGTKIFFLVIFVLVIAAIIETLGIVLLGSRFIP